jgi:hypothetical protein
VSLLSELLLQLAIIRAAASNRRFIKLVLDAFIPSIILPIMYFPDSNHRFAIL